MRESEKSLSWIDFSFVEETFQGSLPAFLASFSAGKRLSDEEVEELQRMIDIYREKKDE